MRRLLSKVMVTSARPRLRRVVEPLKITSAISPPRRLLALCSPSTQRTASTRLLLPEPLGPTMPVMPAGKVNSVRSAKLLNPASNKHLSMGIKSAQYQQTPLAAQRPIALSRKRPHEHSLYLTTQGGCSASHGGGRCYFHFHHGVLLWAIFFSSL